MSNVNELIKELCPDGVKRVALGEVGTFVRGNGLQKSELQTEGFPAIHYGQIHTVYNHAANETKSFVSEEKFEKLKKAAPGDIILATTSEDNEAVGKAIAWLGDTEVAVSGDAIIYTHSLNPSFVSYFLESPAFQDQKAKHISGTKVRRISSKSLSAILIPLPPLEVQEEIVRILDQFVELDRELDEEIAGRVVQFNRVREDLLSDASFPRIPVGNLATRVSTGATPKASESRYYQGGDIPWLRTGEVNFGEIWETEKLITQTALDETNVSWIAENCVIVAISGATAGRTAVNKIPMTTNQHCCNMQINPETADYRFVFHALASSYEELKAQGRGARGDLNTSLIKGFPIPLPPLEVQEEIAAKLDTFTEYIDNLKRERELRQKQYEYYRDQLLDFKVKE